MYQLNGSAKWALTSAGRSLDLSTSGLALLLDRDHWRLLRSEWGDGAGEVKGVAFTADSKNPARMICNHWFWLVGWLRVGKGSGFAGHTDMTIPRVGVQKLPMQPEITTRISLAALPVRVVIDGVLGAPVPAPSP